MSNDDLSKQQSNELGNQPKVPNDPTTRLPESTKGKIQELLDNPEIAHKRQVRHQEVMKMNTFNLKHGTFSKYHPTPEYLQNYLGFIDDITFENRNDVREAIMKLIRSNLKRVALAEHFELTNGSIDPQLSKLIRDAFVQLHCIYQIPSMLMPPEPEPLDLSGLNAEELDAVDKLVTALIDLTSPHYEIPSYAIPS